MQDVLCDKKRLIDYHLLAQETSSLFKTLTRDKGVHHPDTVIAGRAYKRSLELAKHGGRIILPNHLCKKIGKQLWDYISWINH